MNEAWEKFIADHKPVSRPRRRFIYLQDLVTEEEVEIVSENLEVKARPATGGPRGNQ